MNKYWTILVLSIVVVLIMSACGPAQAAPTTPPQPTVAPTRAPVLPTKTADQEKEEAWNSPPPPTEHLFIMEGNPSNPSHAQFGHVMLQNGTTKNLYVDPDIANVIVAVNDNPTMTITVVEGQEKLIVTTGPGVYSITSESNWKMNAAFFCAFSAQREKLDLTNNQQDYDSCIALGVLFFHTLDWPRADFGTYANQALEVIPSEYIQDDIRQAVLAKLYEQGITRNPLTFP